MSNQPQQPAPQLPVVQAKTEIEFMPFGSEDKIKLSLVVIQKYIAVPTREGELPDERDCMKFMMLCRSRRLNPFEGDAFLIGFKKRDANKAEWSLITSISAFYKRAELHPEYSGIQSGVIVRDGDGELREREGDFTLDDDKVLGGWAKVHFKTRQIPMVRRVKLSTYQKPFGVWVTDPAGMICKVAECQCLRDSFPTMCGGMYLREEMSVAADLADQAVREIKRPDFGRGLPPVDIGGAQVMAPKEETTPRKQQPKKEPEKQPEDAEKEAEDKALAEAGLAPEKPQEPPKAPEPANQPEPVANVPQTAAEPAQQQQQGTPETSAEADPKWEPKSGDSDAWASLKLVARKSGVRYSQVLSWARVNKIAKENQSLEDLSENKLLTMANRFPTLLPKIKETKV